MSKTKDAVIEAMNTNLYDPPSYVCPECGDIDVENVGWDGAEQRSYCIGCGSYIDCEDDVTDDPRV